MRRGREKGMEGRVQQGRSVGQFGEEQVRVRRPLGPQGTGGCCSNLHVMYFCSITDAGDAIMNIPSRCFKVSTKLKVFIPLSLPYATAASSLRLGVGEGNNNNRDRETEQQ